MTGNLPFSSPEAALLLVSTKNHTVFSAHQIVRLDFEQAQSDGKSVNGRLLVLDLLRGCDSQCWPNGVRPLGLRMGISILPQSCLHVGKESFENYLCPVLHLLVKCLATKLRTNMLHSSCCIYCQTVLKNWQEWKNYWFQNTRERYWHISKLVDIMSILLQIWIYRQGFQFSSTKFLVSMICLFFWSTVYM